MVTKRLASIFFCLAAVNSNSSAEPCSPKHQSWPYEKGFSAGNGTASVNLHASIDLTRACTSVKAQANAGVDAKLFHINDIELFKATATGSVNDFSEVNVFGEVVLLGSVVDYFSHGYETTIEASDKFNFPINQSNTEVFMVGPVPVDVNYGIQGEAELSYDAKISLGKADLVLTPSVQAKVYASTSLDVSVARIKADGDIVLVDDRMNQHFQLSLNPADMTAKFVAHGHNDLAALSGHVNVEAYANVAGFNKSFDDEIISWPGFSTSNELFDLNMDIQI